ncbi:hypothetical protein T439DRAFT_140771 [Meredithblackwellia eburnea MCA 4105]
MNGKKVEVIILSDTDDNDSDIEIVQPKAKDVSSPVKPPAVDGMASGSRANGAAPSTIGGARTIEEEADSCGEVVNYLILPDVGPESTVEMMGGVPSLKTASRPLQIDGVPSSASRPVVSTPEFSHSEMSLVPRHPHPTPNLDSNRPAYPALSPHSSNPRQVQREPTRGREKQSTKMPQPLAPWRSSRPRLKTALRISPRMRNQLGWTREIWLMVMKSPEMSGRRKRRNSNSNSNSNPREDFLRVGIWMSIGEGRSRTKTRRIFSGARCLKMAIASRMSTFSMKLATGHFSIRLMA